MNFRITLYIGVFMILVSVIIIAISFLISNYFVLVFAIIFLLVSIFLVFFSTTMDIYKRDKELDYDALKAQGLTIIECQKCAKKNVLEDQYCIYCGEKLGDSNEKSL